MASCRVTEEATVTSTFLLWGDRRLWKKIGAFTQLCKALYCRGPLRVLPFQDIGPPFCRVPGRSSTSVSYSVSGESGSDTHNLILGQTKSAQHVHLCGSKHEGRLLDFLCGYASLGFNARSFDLSVDRSWTELYSPRRWPAKEVILTG